MTAAAGPSEHDLIREIRARLRPGPGVVVGVGDDCAVLAPEADRELLITTDAAVEGIHFDLRWMDAGTAGRRAMAANLSDIAAMGGRPRWAVVALGLRPEARALGPAIVAGAAAMAGAHGAAVVGGNITGAPGAISVTIALVGDVPRGGAVLRSGARPGDELWVTGDLGASRAGLLALARGLGSERAAAPLVERFRAPAPRIAEAIFLRERGGPRAMIDLSDGLAADVRHIAAESGAGAVIDPALLPLPPALPDFAARLGADARALALEGGEDFELLCAAPPGALGALAGEFRDRFGIALTRIGRVTGGAEVVLEGGRPLAAGGWDPFAARIE